MEEGCKIEVISLHLLASEVIQCQNWEAFDYNGRSERWWKHISSQDSFYGSVCGRERFDYGELSGKAGAKPHQDFILLYTTHINFMKELINDPSKNDKSFITAREAEIESESLWERLFYFILAGDDNEVHPICFLSTLKHFNFNKYLPYDNVPVYITSL